MTGRGRSAVAACAALLAVAIVGGSGGCTVGSGSGYANGPVWVTGCFGPTPQGDLGTPTMPNDYHLNPTFFAGDPVEAATQPPTNFIGLRMQRNGSAIQYNDLLTFNIQNSYEVARCIRGRIDPITGEEDWDHVGLNLGPWCDWTGTGFSSDGGVSDGGTTTGGTPGRPRIRITSQGYVQASLALLASCPINLLQTSGPALDGHSVDGWIEFTDFGKAAESDLTPTDRDQVLLDFKVNFGDNLSATFHIQFEDHRVLTAIETQPTGPIPTPRMSATLDGKFDFNLLRARSAQPFP
jgi:hypothetical protein